MKNSRIIQLSVGVSVGLHILLVSSATVLRVPGIDDTIEHARKMFRIQSVGIAAPRKSSREVMKQYEKTLQFQSPGSFTPSPQAARSVLEQDLEKPDLEKKSEEKLDLKAKRVHTPKKERVIKEEIAVRKRKTVSKDPIELDVFKLEAMSSEALPAQESVTVPEPFVEEMFGLTPQGRSSSRVMQFLSTLPKRAAVMASKTTTGDPKYASIEEFMNVDIRTWKDSQGQGYFELIITPGRDTLDMESMPKELIFLIDASLSIQKDRIEQFRRGIRYCIKQLNPGDRFNLFIFKDKMKRFAPQSVISNPETVTNAMRFLNRLEASQQTDIYEAIRASIETPPSILPSYLVLLTDGRPTTGITSSAKLIEDMTRQNKLVRSFFAFSGGRKVNRYLLDFISYQNRGWAEYAASPQKIVSKISKFYNKIRHPLLRNMRYQVSQLTDHNVYPKHLPDFFRDAEFVVYGRFREEKEFSIRFIGESNGKKKEMIFQLDLSQAEPATGEIAQIWAFNKIYYLISELTMKGSNPKLNQEIKDISQEFGITTPYDF